MALQITLDDATIAAGRLDVAQQQLQVQGSDYIPVSVTFATRITLGLAILNAIAADDLLWAEFNNAPEEDILRAITSVAYVDPAENISIEAYINAGVHKRTVKNNEVTYLPFVRTYRKYHLGGATPVILDVGVAV